MEELHVEGELSLREVQLASLEILKRIDLVCREEGIRYWLMYGTLIGAVRHKGFIPWDDDLDIAMPRDDYERFISCFPKKKDFESLVAINPDLGKNRPFLITRVSDPAYKMIGEYGDLVDSLGTFVDIYPLDGLGSSMETAIQHKTKAYTLVRSYLQANNFEYNNRKAGAAKRAAKSVLSLMRGDPSKYQEELDKLCEVYSYEDSEYITNLHWTITPDKSIYKRSWFDETTRLRFEDMEAPVPKGYDLLLRVDYGDYMQLPPEGERVGHHYYSIIRRAAR